MGKPLTTHCELEREFSFVRGKSELHLRKTECHSTRLSMVWKTCVTLRLVETGCDCQFPVMIAMITLELDKAGIGGNGICFQKRSNSRNEFAFCGIAR